MENLPTEIIFIVITTCILIGVGSVLGFVYWAVKSRKINYIKQNQLETENNVINKQNGLLKENIKVKDKTIEHYESHLGID